MNYLGHIYLSNNDFDLAVSNLFGDFVKGNQHLAFSETIQKGVLLHRKIDSYIDNHHSVKSLLEILRPELPKVAPIAIDIYFDHLLAKNWEQFHPTKYPLFLQQFYTVAQQKYTDFPPKFKLFITQLVTNNWLQHYPTDYGLDKMCRGVSTKLSFENALNQGFEVFKTHENAINIAFHEYMQDANEYFIIQL